MKKLKYAVLGAGNGGQCIAAYLTLKGYEVSLFDRYENIIKPLKERGGIRLEGVSLTGFANINLITNNIEDVVDKCDVLFVVVPAYAHEYYANTLAPILKGGQIVVLCPGSTGGALEFRKILKERNCVSKVKIAETTSLFYACRVDDKGVANISGIKKLMPIAALPSIDTGEIIEMLKDPFPQLICETDVLTTSMSNLNAIIHPIPVILNTGWIEATGGNFKYYYDSITPTIANLIEKLDGERIKICEELGIKVNSVKDSLFKFYGATGEDLYHIVRNVEGYATIQAPPTLKSRLLLEDIPMGLVPMAEIGRLIKVKTPIMDSVIELASMILETDLKGEGRNLEKLGMSDMGKDSLLKHVG